MSVVPMSKKMHYDHARKAGNRGDVWKHFTIVAVIDGLEVPERFRYVDLHSGAPLHDLRPRDEWSNGIARVLTEPGALKHHSYVRLPYEPSMIQEPAGAVVDIEIRRRIGI